MSVLEVVVFALEMIGTVVFSISGGLVGIERGLDYFGIPVLSMTTAVGGGMLRDLIWARHRQVCSLIQSMLLWQLSPHL